MADLIAQAIQNVLGQPSLPDHVAVLFQSLGGGVEKLRSDAEFCKNANQFATVYADLIRYSPKRTIPFHVGNDARLSDAWRAVWITLESEVLPCWKRPNSPSDIVLASLLNAESKASSPQRAVGQTSLEVSSSLPDCYSVPPTVPTAARNRYETQSAYFVRRAKLLLAQNASFDGKEVCSPILDSLLQSDESIGSKGGRLVSVRPELENTLRLVDHHALRTAKVTSGGVSAFSDQLEKLKGNSLLIAQVCDVLRDVIAGVTLSQAAAFIRLVVDATSLSIWNLCSKRRQVGQKRGVAFRTEKKVTGAGAAAAAAGRNKRK